MNLNYVYLDDREDLSIPLTMESVKQDIENYYSYYPDKYSTEFESDEKFMEYAKNVYNQRQYKRQRQTERAEAVNIYLMFRTSTMLATSKQKCPTIVPRLTTN